MSQIGVPQYLIQGPFGAYGPGWPNGPPSVGQFHPPPGLVGGGGGGRDVWPIQPVAANSGPVQYPQTQTPTQAQQSNQPAPRQPAQTPGPSGGNYGYGSQGAYAAPPTPPLSGAPPQAPAYTPPPQPLPSASAPVSPVLVNGQETPQAAPLAPAASQRPTVMSTPPVNPLHAAIQNQMANNMGGGSFQIPYFTDLLNKRFQGYQTS